MADPAVCETCGSTLVWSIFDNAWVSWSFWQTVNRKG
jgi:hypothetical protein